MRPAMRSKESGQFRPGVRRESMTSKRRFMTEPRNRGGGRIRLGASAQPHRRRLELSTDDGARVEVVAARALAQRVEINAKGLIG